MGLGIVYRELNGAEKENSFVFFLDHQSENVH